MALNSFKDVLHEALDKELENNQDVVLLGENIGTYGGMYGVEEGLLEKYGDQRLLSTPMSKSAVIGAAIGAAMTGLIPVVEISSSDFLTLGLDALINQAAKTSYLTEGQNSIPLVLRVPTGIFEDSGMNQSQNLENLLIGVPGLKIVAPSTPYQARDLLIESIEDPNPVIFVEDKNLYETSELVPNEAKFKLGESVVEKQGTDLTIVSWGDALNQVKNVVNILNKEGIFPEVINPLTLQPLDIKPIIQSVIKTGRLVIVHNGPKTGGLGAEIASQVMESDAFNYLDSPIIRITQKDVPTPFSRNLKEEVLIKDKEILDAVYSIVEMD